MDREQWARLKDTIHHLYIDQNLNCKQVATILREQHDDRVRERTLHRHMKEWGFMKGSHLELLPSSLPWQSPEIADLITQRFWQSKTDLQIWTELQKEGYNDISKRQIRTIRVRNGLSRTSKLDAQGVLAFLAQEQFEHRPSIRKLVQHFREERRIWVTRDVCNEALNLDKMRNQGLAKENMALSLPFQEN